MQVCRRLSGSSGGTTTSVRQFQAALGGKVIAFQDAGDSVSSEDLVSVRCDSGWLGRAYGWANSRALECAEEAIHESDLVVCHMLLQYHAQWAAKCARKFGIPYWVVPHGSLDPYVFSYRAARKGLWLSVVGKKLVRASTRVVFATQREREKAESIVGRLHVTSTLPWPVQYIDLADKPLHRAAIRRRYGIAESERVLLYVGRLQRMKRLLESIEAVGSAGTRRASLIVVGPDGDLTASECQQFCRARGWSNIHFAGPVYGQEIFDFYKAADGFISLSMKENFGHSVAEAMAAGLPVILSPGIDLAPEVANVGCGWMLASVKEAAIAKAIDEFCAASPEALAELGARGRLWVSTQLSSTAFGKELQRLASIDVGQCVLNAEQISEVIPA